MEDDRPIRKFRGMVLDGPRAGEQHASDGPYLRLPPLYHMVTPAEVLEPSFRATGYVHVSVDFYDHGGLIEAFGFWIAEANAVRGRDASYNRLYVMRRLCEGFRPRSSDLQRRIHDAESELDAALQAGYEKRSA